MSYNPFPEDMTIREAKDILRSLAVDGHSCPVCTQFVKVYKRNIPNATARVMIALYHRNEGRDYVFLPAVLDEMKGTPHQGGYGTLGQFWGLMERQPGTRDDGSNRVGWWRLTDRGRAFVRGEVRVPKYARIYNGRLLGHTGDQVTIRDALGKKFDYAELMAGA